MRKGSQALVALFDGCEAWTPQFWDRWRASYDILTACDHEILYERFYPQSPTQCHFTLPIIHEFFRAHPSKHVLEIGGWSGDVAASCLEQFPDILSWTNYEMCRQAAERFEHPRYHAPAMVDCFVWELPLDNSGFDTLVASHVLEHMKMAQVCQVLGKLDGVTSVYADAPLAYSAMGFPWTGYVGSHILECGWVELEAIFAEFGFEVALRCVSPTFGDSIRWFIRKVSDAT